MREGEAIAVTRNHWDGDHLICVSFCPSSSTSDSQIGRNMCDDTEREIVTLGPVNTCKIWILI